MKEPFFVKAFGSAGLSGSDGDLEHELWRQAYGSSNGHSYNFGTAVSSYSGRAEGDMAALTLAPEQAATFRIGAEASKDGFTANLEAFYEAPPSVTAGSSLKTRTRFPQKAQRTRRPWSARKARPRCA